MCEDSYWNVSKFIDNVTALASEKTSNPLLWVRMNFLLKTPIIESIITPHDLPSVYIYTNSNHFLTTFICHNDKSLKNGGLDSLPM